MKFQATLKKLASEFNLNENQVGYTLQAVIGVKKPKLKFLSVSAKSKFTQKELRDTAHQYAVDHQLNPDTVGINQFKDGKLISGAENHYVSSAQVNAPKLHESEGGSNANVPSAADDEEAVLNKLDRSVKFDEVDTITFGLETDDGKIVKVYVNAEQAEAFEKALAQKLGEIDDIEEVLNELSKEYEIVDVEWPEDEGGAGGEDAENADEETGSDSLDQKVYGPKRGKADVEDQIDDSQFEALTMGEELTMNLMESTSSIESRFTTASQLMVYHAILDLGIPEIALARNPYRAAIVKGIKDVAGDVQKSASLKIALKTFIRRAIDFDKKAAENEAEEKDEQQDKRVAYSGSQSKPSLQGAGNKGVKEEMITIKEEKVDWSFSSDKETLSISCKALSFELGSEETEKLIKGVNNRDAVVVRDNSETPPKKIIFSPRGSTLLVKQIGSQEGYMMTSKDIEDLIAAATPKPREKVADDEVKESIDQQSSKRIGDLTTKVADATKIRSIRVAAFLFGGGPGLSDADNKTLTALGYNDGATTYDENKAFWKKCGISKTDYNFICKQSL